MDQWMKDPQAASLLKNRAALEALLKAPDTQKLIQKLNQSAGGSLQSAAQSAAKGDTSALMGILQAFTQSQDGAQLIQTVQNNAQKQMKR